MTIPSGIGSFSPRWLLPSVPAPPHTSSSSSALLLSSLELSDTKVYAPQIIPSGSGSCSPRSRRPRTAARRTPGSRATSCAPDTWSGGNIFGEWREHLKYFADFHRKPLPEPGIDCLIRAELARQRNGRARRARPPGFRSAGAAGTYARNPKLHPARY